MDYIYSYWKLFRVTVFQSSLFVKFVIMLGRHTCFTQTCNNILPFPSYFSMIHWEQGHQTIRMSQTTVIQPPSWKRNFLLFCSHQEHSQRGNGPPQSQDPPRRKFKEKVLSLAHVSGAKTSGLFTKGYCSSRWLSNMSFLSGCHLRLITDFPPVRKFHTDDVYY